MTIITWLTYGALSALVLWFATEAACRLWLRRFGRFYSWTPHTRIRLDLLPDVFPHCDRTTRFDVNSRGERGDEPPGWEAMHVLAMGGSAVECYMNDQETQWPYRVQVELNRPEALQSLGRPRVHVGNIGRSLMTVEHLNRMIERVFDNYERLDVAFMMVGSSDVVAWTEVGAPESNYQPKTTNDWGIWRAHPMGPFTWHPVRSATRRCCVAVWRALRKPIKHGGNVGKSVRRKREMRAAGQHLDHLPDPSSMLEMYRKNLTRLVQLSKQKAERVLVVRTPWFDQDPTPEEEAAFWNLGLGNPGKEQVERYLGFACARRLLEEMDRVTVEVAEAEGVEHVNIRPHLEYSLETFYDEFHLTPKGCRQMGAVVADAILRGADAVAQGPAANAQSSQPDDEGASTERAARRRAQA